MEKAWAAQLKALSPAGRLPKQGASGTSGHGSEDCANCGASVTATYCPECGQKRHVHRSLSAIGHDLLHGVLHLDGKLWDTLPLLTFKPGELTRRYIDGERAKFVSPMAMFLFTVFAMFAVFQMVGISTPTDLKGTSPEQIEELVDGQSDRVESALQDVGEDLAQDDLPADERAKLEARRKELLDQQAGLKQVKELPAFADKPAVKDGQVPIATQEKDGFNFNLTGIEALDAGLVKKWTENPGLMLYKLQANAYKFSWLLIPLSIPFVWLLFAFRRRFKAYDHAIFVTYSLAFMSLLFIVASIIAAVGVPVEAVVLGVMLIPPVHLYKHLRGTYELSRFGAFWRLLALSLFIWIVLILFLQALLLLGAI